jgi:hypothetical protein
MVQQNEIYNDLCVDNRRCEHNEHPSQRTKMMRRIAHGPRHHSVSPLSMRRWPKCEIEVYPRKSHEKVYSTWGRRRACRDCPFAMKPVSEGKNQDIMRLCLREGTSHRQWKGARCRSWIRWTMRGCCSYSIVLVRVGVANSGARGIVDITAGIIKSPGFIVTAYLERRIGKLSDDRCASRPEAGRLTFWVCHLSALNPAGVSAAGASGGAFCFLVGYNQLRKRAKT